MRDAERKVKPAVNGYRLGTVTRGYEEVRLVVGLYRPGGGSSLAMKLGVGAQGASPDADTFESAWL